MIRVCAFELGDTTLLATGSGDKSVGLWDPSTGRAHGNPLIGHTGKVSPVCAFELGDMTLLASGSGDKTVRIWDPATGHAYRNPIELGSNANAVTGVDGGLVVAAMNDGVLALRFRSRHHRPFDAPGNH